MEKSISDDKEKIKQKLSRLKEKINILEWDDQRMQINPYKKMQLEEMKKEYTEIEKRLVE